MHHQQSSDLKLVHRGWLWRKLVTIQILRSALQVPRSQKTWVQDALRYFLHHWLYSTSMKMCITLPIVASGSLSSASLFETRSKTCFRVLPLGAPSVRQQLDMLAVLCQRAQHFGIQHAPSRAELMNSSGRFKCALAQLSNFKLTSQFLALLGGCTSANDIAGWTLGELCCQSLLYAA